MKDKTKQLIEEINNLKRTSPIKSFKDLDVYQISYRSMLVVFEEVVKNLPSAEKFDLTDQIRRSCKAVPRLIAEGFAKRHQNKGFQKYLFDAIGESNETEVSITQALDLYSDYLDDDACKWLIEIYDRISKQTFLLKQNWENYNNKDCPNKKEDSKCD
jgi:four helix bundle protein